MREPWENIRDVLLRGYSRTMGLPSGQRRMSLRRNFGAPARARENLIELSGLFVNILWPPELSARALLLLPGAVQY